MKTPDVLEKFWTTQLQPDLLRFITCGSVDDGKSTLIGRLLWDARQVFDDQVSALHNDSKRFGTQGDDLDFALLVDGLAAEREQGITIDVAYRFFATPQRRFIVADTPGHEQYTRNMVTGASTAEVAILLVDARFGLREQTRRHACICALMGIENVVLAVNKMDAVNFDPGVFAKIRSDFEMIAKSLGLISVTAIPVSALRGDNISSLSLHTPWYKGPSLMTYLESVSVHRPSADREAVFPVQWVNRPNADFRGLSGTLAKGSLRVGDTVTVMASGQQAVISRMVLMDPTLVEANAGEALTLCLDRAVDASRGDILCLANQPLPIGDQFEATLVWMVSEGARVGQTYDLKLATQWCGAAITSIAHRVDMSNLQPVPANALEFNDIAVCRITTTKPIVHDTYSQCKTMGSFILIDRLTHATVAAGMIKQASQSMNHLHPQLLTITRHDRQRWNGHAGKVIWFTGLSGSGKSTLANALEVALHARGVRTYLLDGDNVRRGLNRDLGFSEHDRVENIRRIAEVARLMMDAGLVVLTAFISPFAREREMARTLIGAENFLEVYVSAPLAVCEQRDVKGLYKLARAGKIPQMTGIDSPYEPPTSPQYTADTERVPLDEIVQELLALASSQPTSGVPEIQKS